MDLWEKIRPAFDPEYYAGALPGVSVLGLRGSEVVRLYALLRERGGEFMGQPSFWDLELGVDRPVADVPDPAGLVVSNRASAFYHCLSGVRVGGIVLPTLGVFVFQESVTLDYSPADAWGRAEVGAFFGLLWEVHRLFPSATVTLDDEVSRQDTVLFAAVWREFLAERKGGGSAVGGSGKP